MKKLNKDHLVSRHDTKDVHQLLGFIPDESPEDAPVDIRGEDGQVDVGVGVGRVGEAAQGDDVGAAPELEDVVGVEEVLVEGAVLVPALPGGARLEDLEEAGEAGVDGGVVAAEVGAALEEFGGQRGELLGFAHRVKKLGRRLEWVRRD